MEERNTRGAVFSSRNRRDIAREAHGERKGKREDIAVNRKRDRGEKRRGTERVCAHMSVLEEIKLREGQRERRNRDKGEIALMVKNRHKCWFFPQICHIADNSNQLHGLVRSS